MKSEAVSIEEFRTEKSDEEINRRVAEAFGIEFNAAGIPVKATRNGSLDAMHEAEKVLIQRGLIMDYHWALEGLCDKWPSSHATARQRAIAFLRTINN